MTNPFPPEEFDEWSTNYDQAVTQSAIFPFKGYEKVLAKVVEVAEAEPGMFVLDLGTGTGNLALYFDKLGCKIWGTDFSSAMLLKARIKLPNMQLVKADLREDWPNVLPRQFDRIVSAYVFHHFDLEQKTQIIDNLIKKRLKPKGRLIIADIAFQDLAALELEKQAAGSYWEEEYYWLADVTVSTLANVGIKSQFHQVSSCAGVFELLTK
jgi:putative AdoMet-dependent methyltransferase